MSCSRKGCDEIMCHTHVDEIGYVCRDCQTEFEEFLKKKGISEITEGQIRVQLDSFMNSRKGTFSEGKKINVKSFFEMHTR